MSVVALLEDVFFHVSTVREAKNRFADQLAPDFRIFDYLRTDEYGLSRCLADLLNPQGTHGQKRLFLDIFLEQIGGADWAINDQFQKIVLEMPTDKQRRVDIYLKFKNGVIAIENKPWAKDQNQQLSDYADWLKLDARGKNWLLVYLSTRDPSLSSIDEEKRNQLSEKDQFVQMSYHKVIEWLDVGVAKTRALTVRIFIEELIRFIRNNINRELDMSEAQEIKSSVLKSANNFEAAWFVWQSFEEIKQDLRNKLEKDIRSKLKVKKYELKYNENFFKRGDVGNEIGILFNELQDYCLVFGFDERWFNSFYWGICRKTKDVVKTQRAIEEIKEIMTINFGDPVDSTEIWPWSIYANGIELDSEFLHWGKSSKPYWAMQDGSLAQKIVDIAEKVHSAFKDRMDLLMPVGAQNMGAVSPDGATENSA